MILRQQDVNETYGLQNQTQFSIKASPMAFRILSDGLYSDKIQSIIRELSCNAYDSHKAAGTEDIPFKVQIPVGIDPFFSIRDYGTGLSHDDICTIYSTYFESTKSDSNDFIGALGLGSKSPFSYTDSFTVDSFFEGMKRSYCIFIGETGFPTISMLHEEESEEPSGLKITFEVKKDDHREFKDKSIILSEFKPVPECNIEIQNPFNVIHSTDLFELRSYNNQPESKYFIKQGAVLYPLILSQIVAFDNLKFPLPSDYKCIVLQFPIGSISFTASRESVSYDEKTIEAITERLNQVKEELKEYFLEQFNENLESYPLLKALQLCNSVIGKDIQKKFFNTIEIESLGGLSAADVFDNWVRIKEFKEVPFHLDYISTRRGKISYNYMMTQSFSLKVDHKVMIKDCRIKKSIINDYMTDNNCNLIQVETKEQADEFVKENFVSDEDVFFLSSIKPPREKRASKQSIVQRDTAYYTVNYINESGTVHSDTMLRADLLKREGYFIEYQDFKAFEKETYSCKYFLGHLMKKYGDGAELLILPKNLLNSHKLVDIKTLILKNSKEIQKDLLNSYQLERMKNRYQTIYYMMKDSPEAKKMFIKIQPMLRGLKFVDFISESNQHKSWKFIQGYDTKVPFHSFNSRNSDEIYNIIYEKFPLLEKICNSYDHIEDVLLYLKVKHKKNLSKSKDI